MALAGAFVVLLVPASAISAIDGPTITFACCAYSPADVRVAVNGTVMWSGEFDGGPAHPLRSGTGESEVFAYNGPERSFTHQYAQPGVYHYYCLLHGTNGGTMNGTVTVTDNHPPVAALNAPGTAAPGQTVTLDASGSSDPDAGQTLSYAWDLDGNGTFERGTGTTPTVSAAFAGTVAVAVKVTDSNADAVGPESATARGTVTVSAPAAAPGPTSTATPPTLTPTLTVTTGSKLTLARLRAGTATISVRSTQAGHGHRDAA